MCHLRANAPPPPAAPFDLSRATFVATANSRADIPAPLLDRMEVIQLGGYSVQVGGLLGLGLGLGLGLVGWPSLLALLFGGAVAVWMHVRRLG
jgi:hypothetical protein